MLKISLLRQALCEDRSRSVASDDPNAWISLALPPRWKIYSFHFFVDWNHTPPRIGRRVWLSRAIRFDSSEEYMSAGRAHVESALLDSESWRDYKALKLALERYALRPEVILLPELPAHEISDSTRIWVCREADDATLDVRQHTVDDLKRVIRRESGGPVSVGKKGLSYGTSAIECYLSHTDSAYPGDVDCLIVDENNNAVCIIEHKKHTLRDMIGAHLIERYFPYPDGRKYRRLDALVRHFRLFARDLQFVVLYLSTSRPEGRLQEIGELRENEVKVVRDSGEISFYDRDPLLVGATILHWLRMQR